MSAPKQTSHQNSINPDNFTPSGSGLFVPSTLASTETPPAGAPQLDPETIAVISGNAAQAAINGVLRAMQGGVRRSRNTPKAKTQAEKDKLTELNGSLANFPSIVASASPRHIDLETVVPDGLTIIRKSDDPQQNIAPIPSDRAEAVAVQATNASSGIILGDKFGTDSISEFYAIDENGGYRTLRRRMNPATGKIEYVNEGSAILKQPPVVPGHQAATRPERTTRTHIQHTAAESLLAFDTASRIDNMLAPMIIAKNMLSRKNAIHAAGLDPVKYEEMLHAKVYTKEGEYVGPTTDPEVAEGLMSLIDLAENNPTSRIAGSDNVNTRLFDLNVAGKIRVFDKNGVYVGPTTDPEVLETLRGYDDLSVPIRTRQYLATDLSPRERKTTVRQLRDFLKLAKKGSRNLRESRHHVDHDASAHATHS